MTVTANPNTDLHRRRLLGKVHIGKAALGLDEDTYRDLLETQTGKRSAAKCSNAQLVDLIEHFKSLGFKAKPQGRNKPRPVNPQLSKARALWISAYWLGITESRAESALAAFVKRQTGLDHPAWMRAAADGRKVIEALKSWMAREAGVDWSAYASTNGPVDMPRCRVMEAQWRILHGLGAVRIGDMGALDS